MNSPRYLTLLLLAGAFGAGGMSASLAASPPAAPLATATTVPPGPVGTFRGGLKIIGCNGYGCQGGIVATFTGDGRVKLKWSPDPEAFAAMQAGGSWAREQTMEAAGTGTVRANADGSVSFDNGSYNRFDNCKFDGQSLTGCRFSRADNGEAVAVITFTKVESVGSRAR